MGAAVYPARTQTFAPGDQVPSATLNAIQDGLVAASDEIDDIEDAQIPPKKHAVTATGNQSDSPAPDTTGSIEVWVEKSTNGTTEVVLDAGVTRDWRDRYIHIDGYTGTSADIAGGGSDNAIEIQFEPSVGSNTVKGIFYSRSGVAAGANSRFRFEPDGWITEFILIYASNTTGSLVMRKDAHAADPDGFVVLKITASPVQNHY